jgi:hypothetical protein
MSERLLLIAGVVALAASLLVGAAGVALNQGSLFGSSRGRTISMDWAQASVQAFLDRRRDQDLGIDELMEFDQNFYALIKEKDTGIGAFELLVDKSTAAVGFEPGPDMMWNTKYGMGGGFGHMGFGRATAAMSVTPQRATEIAKRWLDSRGSGYSAGTADAFYGYYTFHFEKDSQIDGMFSVHGTTGELWFHSWHGKFIQSRELGA